MRPFPLMLCLVVCSALGLPRVVRANEPPPPAPMPAPPATPVIPAPPATPTPSAPPATPSSVADTPAAASGQSLQMLLDVSINGHPLNLIGNFVKRDGHLIATAAEWRSLGVTVPTSLATSDKTPIAMDTLPGITGKLDEQHQTLDLTVATASLKPNILTLGNETEQAVSASSHGAVLNYNLFATRSAGQTLSNGLFDGRIYGNEGVLSSTATATTATGGGTGAGTNSAVRLDSTYTFSDPDKLRRIRVGDVVTSGLSWTRTLRLGGVQFANDFTLQPNLVTFPVPQIRGQVAVPSTVDLLINGVRQFSQSVPAGPFELRQIPVVTGASNVAVVVRNPDGTQSVQSLPFYTSGQLLKSGLTSYGGEIGAIRRNYGFFSNDYATPAANLSVRHGINDDWTIEAHGEGTGHVGVAGAGLDVKLGDLGIASLAAAGSHGGLGATGGYSRGSGYLYAMGFQRQSGAVSLNMSMTRSSTGYQDVADTAGDPGQKWVIQAGGGVTLGKAGFFGLTYDAIRYRAASLNFFNGLNTVPVASRASVLSASYTVQVHDNISVYATAFRDFSSNGYGMTLGLSMPIGKRSSIGTTVSRQGRDISGGIQANQGITQVGDVGWNINATQGNPAQRQGEIDYRASWGQPSLAVDQSAGISAYRAGLSGAVVLAGGGIFTANTINDSFAIVRAGNLPNVTVYNENRPVGKTDSRGRIIVPDLRPYQDNAIALDPLGLPLDAQASSFSKIVRPKDRSGVVVDFGVTRAKAARIHLVASDGKDLPLGSMVALSDGSSAAPIGFDGLTYLATLKDKNRVEVALPNGTFCRAEFPFEAPLGKIVTIGPIPCR